MKKCNICFKYEKIESGSLTDEEMQKWNIDRIDGEDGFALDNIKNNRFHLWKCLDCNVFWETRPLYEETMHGGEPGEWVKVTEEYVKEHYPGVLD